MLKKILSIIYLKTMIIKINEEVVEIKKLYREGYTNKLYLY